MLYEIPWHAQVVSNDGLELLAEPPSEWSGHSGLAGAFPGDKCGGQQEIEGIEKVLAALRPTMVTNMFAEVFGTPGPRDTIHDALMTIDFIKLDLKKRRPPDAHVKERLALGPSLQKPPAPHVAWRC